MSAVGRQRAAQVHLGLREIGAAQLDFTGQRVCRGIVGLRGQDAGDPLAGVGQRAAASVQHGPEIVQTSIAAGGCQGLVVQQRRCLVVLLVVDQQRGQLAA